MATVRRTDKPKEDESPRRPPARTPEDRENQLISAAVELAERQIREGTASSQVITHFLKLGSSREKLEQERLAKEVELLEIKRQTVASQERIEELYTTAMEAFKGYSGQIEEATSNDDYY